MDIIDNIGIDKKAEGSKKDKIIVLIYRWVFALIILALSTPLVSIHKYGLIYILLAAILIFYNAALSFHVMRVSTRMDEESSTIMYFDLIFVCIFTFFSGGVNSDNFMIIFFLLGYCAILSDSVATIKFGIFSSVIYTLSCVILILTTKSDPEILSLISRVIIILLASYGISKVNHVVRKYEEQRKAESKLARTDKLTGLANRHYYEQRLIEEVEYAERNNSVLNIMILDLDNFKGFNDTYGHVAGDKLLVLFSDIINQCIRKYDIPVRYGGEEFLILIREMDMVIVRSIGERIRMQLEKQRIYMFDGEEKKKVTVSCGIAQYPTHSNNIKKVVELADQSLYYAKGSGKNIVVTYDELIEQAVN